jgi:nitroreductase
MSDEAATKPTSILASRAEYLIATAARAPSVQNTQPWRFKVTGSAVELYCDSRRQLLADPDGRELLISCGAALYGLRLAVRSLGYLPVVDVLPRPGSPRLLARVTLGAAAPVTAAEDEMLKALPRRHTHRAAFAPDPLPAGLLPELQHHATAERARLDVVDQGQAYQQLADIVSAAARRLDLDPWARAEMRYWSGSVAGPARDGIPPQAFPTTTTRQPGRLRQRDFDLGRGLGLLTADGPGPAVTAVLLTTGDGPREWLCAGQALHRLLLHAATRSVFASLYTQPLEHELTRTLIQDRLALPGAPQMLLQLGVAYTTQATARRPPEDVTG